MLRKLDLDANSLLISSISKGYFVFLMRLFVFFSHSIARYVDWVVVLWRGQQTAGIFNIPEDNNLSCLWSTTSLSLRCGVSLLHRDSFLFIKVRITNWLISKHPQNDKNKRTSEQNRSWARAFWKNSVKSPKLTWSWNGNPDGKFLKVLELNAVHMCYTEVGV